MVCPRFNRVTAALCTAGDRIRGIRLENRDLFRVIVGVLELTTMILSIVYYYKRNTMQTMHFISIHRDVCVDLFAIKCADSTVQLLQTYLWQ